MLGDQSLLVLILEWLTRFPTILVLPQISHLGMRSNLLNPCDLPILAYNKQQEKCQCLLNYNWLIAISAFVKSIAVAR